MLSRISNTLSWAAIAAVFVFLIMPAFVFAAAKEKILLNFNGTDGGGSEAGLIFDQAGNLYGTAGGGGSYGDGTVFELSPGGNGQWTVTVLHSFDDNGSDGSQPLAPVVFDKSGNLYGTTSLGGIFGGFGWGTVFELSPGANGQWTETVLHSFNDNGLDGAAPYAGVVLDAAGNLYGATVSGGNATACGDEGCGTIYELTPGANGQWTEKILYNFNGKDGANPYAALIFDNSGNLYGTTVNAAFGDGRGTVFELTPGSDGKWTHRVLYTFGSYPDGRGPFAGVVFGAKGTLFTSTSGGGANEYGAVVELMRGSHGKWKDKVLHSFNNNGVDGTFPTATPILDHAGNLYGTTFMGGSAGCTGQFGRCGIVFKLRPGAKSKWTETGLHRFLPNGVDGLGPHDSLVFDQKGNLYGTTEAGGMYDAGEIFEIVP